MHDAKLYGDEMWKGEPIEMWHGGSGWGTTGGKTKKMKLIKIPNWMVKDSLKLKLHNHDLVKEIGVLSSPFKTLKRRQFRKLLFAHIALNSINKEDITSLRIIRIGPDLYGLNVDYYG